MCVCVCARARACACVLPVHPLTLNDALSTEAGITEVLCPQISRRGPAELPCEAHQSEHKVVRYRRSNINTAPLPL
jgi:hypothetical protein